MKRRTLIIAFGWLLVVLMGCQSNIKAAPPDFAAFLNYCGAEDFCYQYFMSPNGKYIINYDIAFGELKQKPEDFAIRTIKQVKVISNNGKVIKKEIPEGLDLIFIYPNWSPNDKAFYLYGKNEMVMFVVNDEVSNIDMVSFPLDVSRLYEDYGNKPIYRYKNIVDLPTIYDDYEFFWTPEGELINPRKGGLSFDIYEPDGKIHQITLENESKPLIAYKYISTIEDEAYYYKMIDTQINRKGSIPVLESKQICLSKDQFGNLAGATDLFCMDGRGVLEIISVVKVREILFVEIIFYNSGEDELKHVISSFDSSKDKEVQVIKEYLVNEFPNHSHRMLWNISESIYVVDSLGNMIEEIDPSTKMIQPMEKKETLINEGINDYPIQYVGNAYKYISTIKGESYFYKMVNYEISRENNNSVLRFEEVCLSKSRFENMAGVEDIFCMDGQDVLEVITVVEAEKTLFAEIIFYNTDAGELKHAIYSYDQRKNEEAQLIKEYPMENAVVYQSYPMLREVSGEVFVSNYHEKTAEAIDPKTNRIVPLLIGGRTPQNMIHDGSPWLRIVLYEIGRGSYDVGFYDPSSKKLLLFKDLFPQTWDQDGDGYSDLYFISLGWYESAEQYAYVLINNYDDTAHIEYINPAEYFAQMDD